MRFTKLSGIYCITNKINNKIYIGYSINITMRWYTHIDKLQKNNHDNKKIQKDFNKVGLKNFNFSILELYKGTKNQLLKLEQEYLDKLDFSKNYNIINSYSRKNQPDEQKFINYINKKWLVPKGTTAKRELNKYRIYKDKDKQGIIDMAYKYNILDVCYSKVTFFKCIKMMKDSLGYTVENDQCIIRKKKYTIKMITGFKKPKKK